MLKPFLLTLEYPPDIGGVAKYLEGEVKSFAGEIVVVRSQTMMWPSATRSFSGGWLPLIWRARVRFRREHCDGLWLSHVLPIGYVALVWKWLFKTPYRLYVHGLDLVRPTRSRWKKFWARQVLLSADEIVANSNATACLLTNYGLNPARARVQYPRIAKIETGDYYETGIRLRRQHNINDKPLILTISRLVKRKGIDLVLRALPAVWREIPNLVYVIVGDGDEQERLSVIATPPRILRGGGSNPDAIAMNSGIASVAPQSAGLPRNDTEIIFTGPVSEDEKYGWLAACDCFILTPINDPDDFEGYGIVYKEAQMFGKPVIASRVNGVPEAVGDNGILVEPRNIDEITHAVTVILSGAERSEGSQGLTTRSFGHLRRPQDDERPKVSIIIPLYNHAKELVKCLQSIKRLTFADYEIVIVNDGSTDATPEKLLSLIESFNFSTSQLLNQPNSGAPTARNNGFAQSTGQYIIFCDADVSMRPDMLAKMVKVLDENPQISYVYSSFKFGWKKFKLWPFSAERLRQMPYIHTTSLMRREHFPGFSPSLKRLQDWDLWLTMLEQGHVGQWIPEVLFATAPGRTMSAWLPSFIAKLGMGKKAKDYQRAVAVVKNKHRLNSKWAYQ